MLTALASSPLALHAYGPWGYGHGYGFPWPFVFVPVFWIAVIVVFGLVFGRRWRRAAAYRAQYGYGPGRGFGPWGHGGWGLGGHGFGAQGPWGQGGSAAEQVLADRFARGDIDEVEYRARLEVLRSGQTGPQGPGVPYASPSQATQGGPQNPSAGPAPKGR